MQRLTRQQLSDLENMQDQLNIMSNRVRDLLFGVVSDDECDPCFLAAARLSQVDSAFDVLSALLIEAVTELDMALHATDNTGKVVPFVAKPTKDKD
jgi:hypothetical protein